EEEEPPYGWYEETGAPREAHLEDLKHQQTFIKLMKNAKLDDCGLDEDALDRLRNPRRKFPKLSINRVLRLALRQFIDNGHSEKAYRANRLSAMEYNPELELPTLEKMRKLVAELTGVVPIKTDMCINSCMAYTGAHAHRDKCPSC
ncbi:hypothetical protein C8T65DRAFT_547376, partial [Cerioporus squamosus]